MKRGAKTAARRGLLLAACSAAFAAMAAGILVMGCSPDANLLAAPVLAAAGNARAAWGTLPQVDLFLCLFCDAMSESHFRDWMRMSKGTFEKLALRLGRTQPYREIFDDNGVPHRGGRGRVRLTTLRREIAIAMYVLSGNEPFHRVSTLWGKGAASSGSVHQIVKRFVSAVNAISDEYIFWPESDEDAAIVVKQIESLRGLPGCVGIVDGTHVEIPAPSRARIGAKQYISYKKRYTLIMQGVVDGCGMFTHVVAGFPGSMNDASIFAHSGVYPRLARTVFRPDYPGRYILGDSAYGLRVFCLRGYAYDTNDDKEKVLNAYCHSTRAVVENAFGRLKGRFRCAAAARCAARASRPAAPPCRSSPAPSPAAPACAGGSSI